MAITDEEFRAFAMNPRRPIPGQSFTTNPETPPVYDTAPEFTNKQEALRHFFSLITEENRFMRLMGLLEKGVPVMDIVQLLLIKSYQKGEINPDLMLIIAEPLAYLLLGLAERQGIQAVIVDDPDDPDEDETNMFRAKMQTIRNPQEDEELQLQDKIDSVPSLMERSA